MNILSAPGKKEYAVIPDEQHLIEKTMIDMADVNRSAA